MATGQIHVGDTGTVFRLTSKEIVDGAEQIFPISTATIKEIILRKPKRYGADDTRVTKTAAFSTDGVDGRLQFVSLSSDFDIAGCWRAQARLVFPTGEWKSSDFSFEVFPNL